MSTTDVKDGKKGLDQKRKADESPEPDKPYPRLRRRGSLHDLHESSDPKTSYSLPELMKKWFMDKVIMKTIVPSSMAQLQSFIENAIRNTMETVSASTIATAIEESLSKYKKEVIQPILDGKDAEMNDLKKELKLNSKKVKGLETKITN